MSSNAGGAATNAGIDFQQRVSALLMTHMLMNVEFIDDLGLNKSASIESLFFESSEDIDDIVVKTDIGTVYIQAKRSISCSTQINSEFSKVIYQFVSQYNKGVEKSDRFLLATSSKASSRIYRDLRKITESLRNNDEGFIENPLSQTEKTVLSTLTDLVRKHYLKVTKTPIEKDTENDLLKKIYVSVLDIEEGMPLEKAIITLISGKSLVTPSLVWASLISLGLSLSKNRSSINKSGLDEKIGRFLKDIADDEREIIKNELLELQTKRAISSGREVLLINSFIDEADYMIAELIRFEGGKKRLKFYQDKCELLNGDTWTVIHRASTFAGIERYIESNKDTYKDKEIVLLPINSQSDFDSEVFSKSHSELCLKIFHEKNDDFICMHCGDAISEDQTPLIEIDEEGKDHDVGFIHKDCIKPIDRILGVIDAEIFCKNPRLNNFDYNLWFECVVKGQGLFRGTAKIPGNIYTIWWKPDYSNISKGKFCVMINLEDGSTRYVHERGKVVRESEESADIKVTEFNDSLHKAKLNKDPWCYTSENEIFTTYSNALRLKQDNEECVLCVNSVAVKFTKEINAAYSLFSDFYAPLMILLEKETGLPIVFSGAIFLLSDPLEFERYILNWQRAGIELPDYTVSIIESDPLFDKLIQDIKEDGLAVLIDPEIDMNQKLTTGFVVENYYDELSNKAINP